MKIFGVTHNYPEHNKEHAQSLYNRVTPIVFSKADSSLLKGGKPFFIPDFTHHCEYEAAVVVKICKLGRSISPRFAHRYYDEITLGIDFTAKDLLESLRKEGLPWEVAKGFDGSATVGNFIPLQSLKTEVQNVTFRLDVNGKTAVEGNTKDMLHQVDEIVSYLSQFYTLKMGDLIYTGSPVSGGQVQIDDHFEGWIEGQQVFSFYAR